MSDTGGLPLTPADSIEKEQRHAHHQAPRTDPHLVRPPAAAGRAGRGQVDLDRVLPGRDGPGAQGVRERLRVQLRHPELVARREQEVQLLERHMGRIPVSELLPNSEPELAEYRPELIRRLNKLDRKSTRLNSSHVE